MKVEMHSHTDLYSPCSRIPPKELVLMAETSGYDALFITDHNKVWPRRELAALQELCERTRILPGIEISLPDSRDMLVLGAEDPEYENLRTADEVLAKACAEGLLTVIAHPFRYHTHLPDYSALADALEIKTCNHSRPEAVTLAESFAAAHKVAPVYASDAHGLNFLNKFWIETQEEFSTAQEFRRLVVAGRYANRTRPFDMALPPAYKVASMEELSEADLVTLSVESESLQ
ncbi:MAG: PHP domain-containing protein [Candidatus Hydrogenedentota bacterium]